MGMYIGNLLVVMGKAIIVPVIMVVAGEIVDLLYLKDSASFGLGTVVGVILAAATFMIIQQYLSGEIRKSVYACKTPDEGCKTKSKS